MKKTKKTNKTLALSKTTLRRMDLAAVSGGRVNIPVGGVSGVVCTLTCACKTGYTSAQSCCFTC